MAQVSQVSSDSYIPLDNEPYMSKGQLAYFKGKLMQRKSELHNRITKSIEQIKN